MYQIGHTVMHPSEGVCAVEDIRTMRFGAGEREYYVLRPTMENGSSRVYLPIDRGDAVLRKLLSREDILDMIRESDQYAGLWIEDSRPRKEAFGAILREGNYAKIIRMLRELHEHNAQRAAAGKRLPATDKHLLDDAQRLLHQEFSYVLGMNPEDTVRFILHELGIDEPPQL